MTSLTLIPLLVFLFVCLIVAFLIRKHTPEENFEREYFVAGRRLGPIVLVMTTIATFGSITTFVGMPGQAWEYGFGWVYLAGAQVVSLILLFGVVGKKLALIARRIHAVSIIDIINARFRSNILTLILSCSLVVFFTALIVAQLVGAAKIFVAVTDYEYSVRLILITATTAIYTVIGGFRGVAIADTICSIVMIVSALFLGFGIMNAGGGYENIMQTIAVQKPRCSISLRAANAYWPLRYAMAHLGTTCIHDAPGSSSLFKLQKHKSLRHALWIGTLIVGLLLGGTHCAWRAFIWCFPDLLNEHGGTIDDVIPLMLAQAFPLGGGYHHPRSYCCPRYSTVSTLLISSSVNIIQGIYANSALRQRKAPSTSRPFRFAGIFDPALGRCAHRCSHAARPHLAHEHVRVRRHRGSQLLDLGAGIVLASCE